MLSVCNVQLVKIAESRLVESRNVESQRAMLSILGEYADLVCSGPHVVEQLLNNQALDCTSPECSRLSTCLLMACCRLFLRRPAEYQHILGRVLELCMNSSDANVHDKAAMYYMLLSTDIQLASAAILSANATQL